MNWKKVTVEIDPEVRKTFHHIQKIQPNSCIAGGYLCDQYLGYQPKDVDIFIKDKKEINEHIIRFMENSGARLKSESQFNRLYKYKIALDVKTYQLDDLEIQLVFTEFGIQAVKHFDYRFREFFYFKNQAYASLEALEDIQRKELVFGVTKAPLVAVHRLVKFSMKYKFNIDPDSTNRLFSLFNSYEVPKPVVEDYMKEKVLNESYRKEMNTLFEERSNYKQAGKHKTIKFQCNELHNHLLQAVMMTHVPRDVAEKCFQIQKETKVGTYDYSFNPYDKELSDKGIYFIKELKKEKMRLVLRGYAELSEDWAKRVQKVQNENSESKLKEYIFITQEAKGKTKSIYCFDQSKQVFDKGRKFSMSANYTLSTQIEKTSLQRFLVPYSKGELLEIELDNLGTVLINKKTKKVLGYRCDYGISRQIKAIIEDFIKKEAI